LGQLVLGRNGQGVHERAPSQGRARLHGRRQAGKAGCATVAQIFYLMVKY
jgi:hypothetical protein